ncbi:MAG: hypothetical protein KAJ62_12020 [Desulfobacteraceae bacterium]|nr:hypothetical protein [Desulfobacteraceae bacterium]
MNSNEKQADILFLNAKVVNVFTEEVIEQNVAVKDGYFLGFVMKAMLKSMMQRKLLI